MPAAPLRACPRHGSHQGPCPDARKRQRRALDQRRGSAASRGYDKWHRKWRQVVLARDPVCANPYGHHQGLVVPATVADHIVPLSKGGTWALSNGQGLCARCHGAKTAQEGRWGRVRATA